MRLATREIIREIDRISIEEYRIPGLILMDNGGDGFVISRHLISEGLDVTTYLTSDPKNYRGDALTNLEALHKIGGKLIDIRNGFSEYQGADLIIDALFGTGLDRNVEGLYRDVIHFINSQSVPRIAVDIPSGLDADTGFPLGVSVKAEITLKIAFPKIRLALHPGSD